MNNNLINSSIAVQRDRVDEAIKDLHELTIEIGHQELAKTVSDLRNRIHDPFLFVIVGEVKAGKSSFVNALLDTGREITKVAPQPMTDTIQQIVYGEQESISEINPYLKKITVPVDILQEIAIVDTPGTNTIVDHHQEITEQFVPVSDLIIFVFEAKNPYRQSAWEFFDYIHTDWRKKIIFVLQQKDLMNTDDLNVNIAGVKEQAIKKGIEQPLVFAVSAKQEQEGHKEESGFLPLRNYVNENITGGKAPKLKLTSNLATATNINNQIAEGISLRRRQLDADLSFRQDITQTLDRQQVMSNNQVMTLTENLLASYDRITKQKEEELISGLSFFKLVQRSFKSIFDKSEKPNAWLEQLAKDMENELTAELESKLTNGVADLAESIGQMVNIIGLKIRNSETILQNDHELFSNIAEKRSTIILELQEAFNQFVKSPENFNDETLFPDRHSLSPNLATGSGMAAIGMIIMTVAQTSVFDITGGILTGVGLLFAGVTTQFKKTKIIQGFKNEIATGRQAMQLDITNKLTTYIEHLKGKIDNHFNRFDRMLQKEEETIGTLTSKHDELQHKMDQIQEAL